MELSYEIPKIYKKFEELKKQKDNLLYSDLITNKNNLDLVFDTSEILDLSKIYFDDDETWLCPCSPTTTVKDLKKWLYQNEQSQPQKSFDTRTFTRPKKRFARPSIEKYNENLYGNISTDNGESNSKEVDDIKPVNFDLSQQSSSYYFDKILTSAPSLESFQNMSPPSLVNSMCSSTFANLMESSFIKNDPVLKEISTTDYTESVLLQDYETPTLQSFSESFSSLNSDSPEVFLQKMSLNETFTKSCNLSLDDTSGTTTILNELNDTIIIKNHYENVIEDGSEQNLNRTFQKPSLKPKTTFRVADRDRNNARVINRNSQISLKSSDILNYTFDDALENSYKHDLSCGKIKDLNSTFNISDTTSIEETSFGSPDVNDITIIAVPKKESSDMLNMSNIDAIVEMQERSLHVMSTPKTKTDSRKILRKSAISPIKFNELASDSDKSSSDEPKSIKSTTKSTKRIISTNTITKQKSLGYIGPEKISKYSVPNTKIANSSNFRGSYTNLKISSGSNLGRSQPNLYKTKKVSSSNLNTMDRILKGSYTSLKPISSNLPVVPPIEDKTTNLKKISKINVADTTRGNKAAEILVNSKESSVNADDARFVKPKPVRASALPRPFNSGTGIPRPASRIPGPRSTRTSKLTAQQGNFDDCF